MRAIDCHCGLTLKAADDEELFRLSRGHFERYHPDPQRTEEQLRKQIAAAAYDVDASSVSAT